MLVIFVKYDRKVQNNNTCMGLALFLTSVNSKCTIASGYSYFEPGQERC